MQEKHGQTAETGHEGSHYKAGVLSLLLLAYTFNFIDRTIINTIGQAIKVDLQLTDTQLGLLGGLAFAVFYTVLGIPIARLADRKNRVVIISVSIALWSALTAACGAATSYLQLFLLRIGVGVGEAGLSPPAHSLISDYFEPNQRASALGIYALGIPLGVMFGAVAGGWIADNYSWRMAFVLVGLPGLLVALLVKLIIREPTRGQYDATPLQPVSRHRASLADVIRSMLRQPGVANVVLGCTLVSLASYGTSAYAQAFFIRDYEISYTLVGLIFGVIGGLTTGIGTVLGGWIADKRGSRDPRWYALVPALGVSVAAPFYFLVFTRDTWEAASLMLVLPGVFHFMYVAPTFGFIQNAVVPGMRATAAAILLFVVNIIGLGIGPPLCGWLIDTFSTANFAELGIGEFAALCPGGIGAAGAEAYIDEACRASVVSGTRIGILITLTFFAWGALHYYAAAISLSRSRTVSATT
jgi:predicted MFS family arabinose efflux permease